MTFRGLLWLWIAAACAPAPRPSTAGAAAQFPEPGRPVASIVSATWDNEADRDSAGEAERVFRHLGIERGMRVADIGAGSGYYTVRLARRLGPGAAIVAQDIDAGYLAQLERRLEREKITGVTTVLGEASNPKLDSASIDLAILSHMYHEIKNPYEFLHNLQPALAPGGRVGIIDLDRPTASHGTPPRLLRCELEAAGYRQIALHRLTPADGYLAVFAAPERRPGVSNLRACHLE